MLKHSKLTKYKIEKILRCFSEDLPAVKTATLLGLNRKTVDRYYNIFREKIALASMKDTDNKAMALLSSVVYRWLEISASTFVTVL